MATDVARVSFDPARRYTDTVPQQGRVTLEAEENEQRAIQAAERLRELREIVGPAGTPDDGYAVSDAGGGDLTIGAGTMYVGGVRVELDAAEKYGAQPDWADCVGDPAYLKPGPGDGDEHVVLVLTEYDVTATEDPVLREVALGGPDASARRRIVQRVRRIGTDATDCAGATATDAQTWKAEGLEFDPATMRLNSQTTLLVVRDGPVAATSPCEPGGSGGYIGAENQNIRVQVCRADANSGTFDVVWGWDNGSALYRVSADTSTNPVLTLDRAPVDDFHRPRAGQPVELLRAAADLVSTDGVTEGWVAELTGQVGVLAAPYDPDTRTVVFPAAPPSQYLDASVTPQLYMRVWEELKTGVKSGDTVALTGTGLNVQLTVATGEQPHVGDFWSIAVRPSTPDTVLPARLLRTAQPPDGPRMWACPLAVVSWSDGRATVVEDCRVPFPPLTGITTGGDGCCAVSVEAKDAERLQEIINHAAAGRRYGDVTQRITICLKPGRYELAYPLRLHRVHSEMHLEGCGEGAVLTAAAGREDAFDNGLIQLLGTKDVRITGITFEAPAVRTQGGVFSHGAKSGPAAGSSSGTSSGTSAGSGNPALWTAKEMRPLAKQVMSVYSNIAMSIAIRTVHAVGLSIEDCTFHLSTPRLLVPRSTGAEEEAIHLSGARTTMAVGIFANGVCDGWVLRRNSFVDLAGDDRPAVPTYLSAGFMLAPSVEGSAAARSTTMTDVLTDSVISDNRFSAVSVGVYAIAQVGELDVFDNVVTDCYGGFWFVPPDLLRLDLVNVYQVKDADPAAVQTVHDTVAATLLDPALLTLSTLARVYPQPEEVDPPAAPVTGAAPSDPVPASPAEVTKDFVAQAMATSYTLGNPVAAASSAANAAASAAASVAEARMWRPAGSADAGASAPQSAAAPQPAAAPKETVDFNGGVGTRAKFVAAAGSADSGLRELTLSLADLGPHVIEYIYPPMTLRLHDNRVRCLQPDQTDPGNAAPVPGKTGPALILGDRGGAQGTALVTGNDFQAALDIEDRKGTTPVAGITRVGWTTVTGNMIRRAQTPGYGLVLVGTDARTAVTGNVVYGDALLPDRPNQTPPLDTWWPLNTIIT